MNIYVGNLSYDITGDDLQAVFTAFGYVESVKIIRDKITGESRGFAFIEMPNKTEAEAAIQGVPEVKGRKIIINEARPPVRHGQGGGMKRGTHGRNFNRRERRY